MSRLPPVRTRRLRLQVNTPYAGYVFPAHDDRRACFKDSPPATDMPVATAET